MRRILLSTLAAAVLLGTSSVGLAQAPAGDLKTVLTISFSGYDNLLESVKFIGELGGNPDLADMLQMPIEMATEGKGLLGLDTTKPWGVVVQTDGGQDFPVVGFVPVTDLDKLLETLSAVIGEAEDVGGGVLKIQPPADPAAPGTGAPSMFVKQAGNWVLIAPEDEYFAAAPADPIQALGGLNEEYIVAVRASVQNIPKALIDQAKSPLEVGLTMRMPGEGDEEYAVRTGVARQMFEQIETLVNDLDEVLLGWAVDRQTKSSYFDFQLTAVEGSKTAAQFNQGVPAKTNFAGFNLPGAAVSANWAALLSDDEAARAKTELAKRRKIAVDELASQGLAEEDVQLATRLITDLLEVVEKTIDTKVADGGLALMLEPGESVLVAGGAIGGGATLEKVLKQLAQLLAQHNPELAKGLKLDAQTHAGVRFHSLTLPTPDESLVADAADVFDALFGQTMEIVFGIGDNRAYLAVGNNAAGTIKQVIDKSQADAGTEVVPMRFAVSLTPIAKFAEGGAPDGMVKMMVGNLAMLLEQSDGKDHVTVTSKAIPDGASVRLEIEEGVLKLIGFAAQMMGGMGGPGGPGGPPPADGEPF